MPTLNEMIIIIIMIIKSLCVNLAGCEVKCMTSIFKTEMLIYQSKTNLDKKISLGRITHQLDPEIGKMLARFFF